MKVTNMSSYTWTVVNNDPSTIQFCVVQSGGYANCASIPGNSTQTFAIPDIDVQIYGTPTGYYVYYTSVQVKTSTQSLPPSGSTITVPPFQGCDPLLTQGQGYPPIIPCKYPGIIFIKSESTPSMFVENYGAVPSGFQYGYGIAGGPLALAMGPNWQYYRQYPSAKVYLIGNWRVTSNGNYYDEDSGRTFCGCQGATVYVIPNSALPAPSTGTTTGTSGGTTGGSTTGGSTTGGSTTTGRTTGGAITQQTGVTIHNTCDVGITAYIGDTIVYVGPKQSANVITTFPAQYSLLAQGGETVGQGTANSGETISPTTCPSTSPQTSTAPSLTQSIPWGILLLLVLLGILAMGGGEPSG